LAGIAVVTDSTADFAGAHPADLDVTVVPLTVNWGHDVLRDGIDVDTSEFYLRLRTDHNLPKTAAPPLGIFEEVYHDLLATHDAVISIHIASQLSGTYGVAANAARGTDAARLHVVDSTSTSVGLGWLAIRAAQLARAGESADSVLREVRDMIPRLRLFVTLESLEYLQRGGRIGRAQAFLGSLLNVKPVLQVLDGQVHPIERVRTRAASVRRVAQIAAGAGPKELVAVVHGDCEPEAMSLRNDVAVREGADSVPVVELGSVLATHAGPGVIGVGCLLRHGSPVEL
jgi:DegV family protein with EDD domain